jgi:hypothetical protein
MSISTKFIWLDYGAFKNSQTAFQSHMQRRHNLPKVVQLKKNAQSQQ